MVVAIQVVQDGGIACIQDDRGYVTVVRTGAIPPAVELPWRLPRPVRAFGCGWQITTAEEGGIGLYDVARHVGRVEPGAHLKDPAGVVDLAVPDPKETVLLYRDGTLGSLWPGIQAYWTSC